MRGARDETRVAQVVRAVWAGVLVACTAALAGCAGSSATPPAAPKGPTACERASDSMVGAMMSRLPASDAPTEMADALRNLIRERCEQDGWSAEATRCLWAMKRLEDAEPCAKLLTEAQQAALVRDQEARFGAAGAAGPVEGRGDGRTQGRRGEGKSEENGGSGSPDRGR